MKLDVNYKIVNLEYDKEYAEVYNWGEPGPGNMKYHETWKYRIEEVEEFSQNDNATLKIDAIDMDGGEHSFQINNLFRLKAMLKNGEIEEYHVSKDLIRNTHETKGKNGHCRFYFYLDVKDSFVIINETSYILSKDVPDGINNKEWKSLSLPNEVKSTLIEKSGSLPMPHNK